MHAYVEYRYKLSIVRSSVCVWTVTSICDTMFVLNTIDMKAKIKIATTAKIQLCDNDVRHISIKNAITVYYASQARINTPAGSKR